MAYATNHIPASERSVLELVSQTVRLDFREPVKKRENLRVSSPFKLFCFYIVLRYQMFNQVDA